MKPQSGKTMSRYSILHFFRDNADELLPIVIRDGLATFSRRFCELHQTQPGQFTGPSVEPKHIEKELQNYFDDHVDFYQNYVLTALATLGGDTIALKEEDIEIFYDIIKDEMENSKLSKSETLTTAEQMIIAKMVLPTAKKPLTDDSEFKSVMFVDEEAEVEPEAPAAENEISEPIQSDDEIESATPVVNSVTDTLVWESKNPHTANAYSVMNPLLIAAYDSDDKEAPTNKEVREAIVSKFPEMAEWVENHYKFISKILSEGCKVLSLSTRMSKIRAAKSSPVVEQDVKTASPRKGKGASTPERVLALEVIHAHQCKLKYRKPKFYTTDEMITKISSLKPNLTEWLSVKENRAWVSMTISGIKLQYQKDNPVPAKEQKEKPAKVESVTKPVPPVEKPASKTPVEKLKEVAEIVAKDDLESQVANFVTAMRSGTVPPIEILRNGEPLLESLTEHIDGLVALQNALAKGLGRYKALISSSDD